MTGVPLSKYSNRDVTFRSSTRAGSWKGRTSIWLKDLISLTLSLLFWNMTSTTVWTVVDPAKYETWISKECFSVLWVGIWINKRQWALKDPLYISFVLHLNEGFLQGLVFVHIPYCGMISTQWLIVLSVIPSSLIVQDLFSRKFPQFK